MIMEIRIHDGCSVEKCVKPCVTASIGDIDEDEFDVLCNLVIASEKHLTSLTMARMVAVFKNAYEEFDRIQKINKKKA
jgi:hypothetical protein